MIIQIGSLRITIGRAPATIDPSTMKEPEVHAALRAMTTLQRQAIHTLLDGTERNLTLALADTGIAKNHGDLAHAAGGICWLGEFRTRFDMHWKRAREDDPKG